MGSVRKSRNGRYEARWYDPDGRQHSQTFRKKANADRHVRAMEDAKDRGSYIDLQKGRTTPFRRVAEEWLATTEHLKPKTREGYKNILDYHLLPSFGHLSIARIEHRTIDQFLAGLEGAEGTKRNVFRVLDMVMKYAVRKGVIGVNPTTRADRPKATNHHADDDLRVLTVQQVAALADAIGRQYELLVTFAAYTGMRAGEIGALRVKDLELRAKAKRVTVRESVSDVNGHLEFVRPKNGRVRKVALPAFLVEPLAEAVEGKGQEELVFTGEQGGTLRHHNFYGRHFKPAVRAALPEELHSLRFHDLRHTCASLLIKQEVHPLAVSRHLGHSSIQITMDRYGHLFPDEQEAVATALDDMHMKGTG